MSRSIGLWTQVRPGDWLILVMGCLFTGWLFYRFWFQQDHTQPTHLIVWSQKEIVANIVLPAYQHIHIGGPLGETIIMIDGFRAKVAKDPGPRQYCVSQGWLTKPGDIDICLPNQISLYMPEQTARYDSFNY